MLRLWPRLRILCFTSALLLGCRAAEKAEEPAPKQSTGKNTEQTPTSATAREKDPTAVRTYDIPLYAAKSEPKIKVSIQLPSSWKEQLGDKGELQFAVPSLTARSLGVLAIPTDAGDPAARVEQAFKWQYEAGDPVIREQKADGRLWASHAYGAMIHARMFVPAPGGVVMGVALLRDATEPQLAEVKATFETIQIVAQ